MKTKNTKVVRPLKELVAYKRISVNKNEKIRISIPVSENVTSYYDADMVYGKHGGEFTLLVGTSAENTLFELPLK